ncbi:MAG: TrkH family potassium uptake protein [Methanoregula sp.]|jgi:trk system potassium uptake protein TrkH|nr:TrkH family potassium uptake protein [Methanoregula sp.]
MQRLRYLSTIVSDVGDIFVFIAPVSCVPLLIALLYAEWNMLLPMAAVPVVFFLSGMFIRSLPRNERGSRLSTAFCSVALFWFACALVSGIPFMLGLQMSFIDAFFEGMAGWTGTAFSMMTSLDTAPHTLLFWRSYMQWVGGIGIIAFAIALGSSTGLSRSKIFRTESRDEPFMPSVMSTGRALFKIYALLTFIAVGLILFTGLSLWESVNLGLTTISTGGFTLHEGGILYYDSIFLELLLIPIMIVGALPFKLYYLVIENRQWSLFGDMQVKLFLIILAIGAAVLTYDLIFFVNLSPGTALHQGIFMTVSAMTTTGYQITSLHPWADVTILFFALIAFVGGAAGSAAGGIKLNRVWFALQALFWWFQRLYVSGKVLIPFRIEGRIIPKATAELETAKNMLIIILSVATVFIATLIILQFHLTTYSITEILFSIISAFSTCGINSGYVSPDMPVISKWVFIVTMWIGRLEVIPVVMLMIAVFKGED